MDSKYSRYGGNGVLCELGQKERLKRTCRWTRRAVEDQPVATSFKTLNGYHSQNVTTLDNEKMIVFP